MEVITPSRKVRDAAQYVNEQLTLHPEKSRTVLIDEAGMRFNLTPLDTESLLHIFGKKKD